MSGDAGGTDVTTSDSISSPDGSSSDATNTNDTGSTDAVSTDAVTQDAPEDGGTEDASNADANPPHDAAPPEPPLVGTWSTGSVTPGPTGGYTDANSQGITSFTYTVTFHADMTFTGAYTRTFNANAQSNAGCTEAWTITGWNWSAMPAMGRSGLLSVQAANGGSADMVTRSGCSDSNQDTGGPTAASDLDIYLPGDQSENFAISMTSTQTTLVLSPVQAFFGDGVPIDSDTYTLIKQ